MVWSVCALAALGALWFVQERLADTFTPAGARNVEPSVELDDVADVVLSLGYDFTLERVRGTALPGESILDLLDSNDMAIAGCALSRCLKGEPSRFTARLRFPDDRVLDFRAVPVTMGNTPVGMRLFGWDISTWRQREDAMIRRQLELEKANQRLRVDANTDALTGLANRRHLLASGSRVLKNAIEQGHTVTCVYMDLDHFKSINDTLGHEAGDRVLEEFAALLKSHVRADDVVARIGGEEFVILLPALPPHRAMEIARRIRRVVSAYHFSALPAGDHVTVSIGVATYNHDGLGDMQELLAAADEAAYESKTRGRNRVSIHSDLATSPGSGMVPIRELRPPTRRLRPPGARTAPDSAGTSGEPGTPEAVRSGGPADETWTETAEGARPRRVGGRLVVRDPFQSNSPRD